MKAKRIELNNLHTACLLFAEGGSMYITSTYISPVTLSIETYECEKGASDINVFVNSHYICRLCYVKKIKIKNEFDEEVNIDELC